MCSSDPQRSFAIDVVRRLRSAGFQALWAGGCVRDLLLKRLPKDYDVATDATPDDVRDLFGRRKTIAVGASFGVIVVVGPREAGQVEVATFRTEGPYLDGRHPSQVSFASPRDDALRRDFTINGMFYDPIAETVLDYVGGTQDLERGIVRAIGEPRDRMEEDRLRMLRAVRFAAILNFTLEEHTGAAIRELAHGLSAVSVERISDELHRMLAHESRAHAVAMIRELGLLQVILPELTTLEDSNRAAESWRRTVRIMEALDTAAFEPALAALLIPLASDHPPGDPDPVEAVCRRLRLSNREVERVVWLLGNRHALTNASSLPLSRVKRILSVPDYSWLLQLMRAERAADEASTADIDWCDEYVRSTAPEQIDPPPLVTGEDLLASGLSPGPVFHKFLDRVRNAQLDELIHTREEALAMLRSFDFRPEA